MKVLVLGATGSVGRHILQLGTERGHEITALIRKPEKLEIVGEPSPNHQSRCARQGCG
jgi:putative NADH-flavin reductase